MAVQLLPYNVIRIEGADESARAYQLGPTGLMNRCWFWMKKGLSNG
jgi:hypothetical protein